MENFLLLVNYTMVKKFIIINCDPIAITYFLRLIGRENFKDRMNGSFYNYPRFNELFFELNFNSCWLMAKGEYKNNVLFQLKDYEIPLYGWQISARMEKQRKIK